MIRLCFYMLLSLGSVCVWAQTERYSLDHGWEFRQAAGTDAKAASGLPAATSPPRESAASPWRPATIPGDVHLDLLAQKLIADPFYGTNEAKLQWISKAAWEYRTRFEAPSTLRRRAHVDLVFEGLDAAAMVYLNGDLVLTANNQFRVWRVDAKPYLKSGPNELRVVFPPQDAAAEEVAKRDPWYPRNTVPARSYLRKAAYEHGWDWGPVFVTSGIWRPVHLDGWDEARIADFHVKQNDVSSSSAHLSAEVEIEAGADTRGSVEVTSTAPGGGAGPTIPVRPLLLHPGRNVVSLSVDVAQPQLWFPAGYGSQPLYTFQATLHTGAGKETRTARVGLRSLRLRRDLDKWGRSFEFVINGVPVFAKGTDVIPSDSFANRVTPAQYRAMLVSARDANMNMVRLWGGRVLRDGRVLRSLRRARHPDLA